MNRYVSIISASLCLVCIRSNIGTSIADDVDRDSTWIGAGDTKRLGGLRFREGVSDKQQASCISRDGRFLAVIPACDMSLIDVYDLTSGTKLRTVRSSPGKDLTGGMAFSPDGQHLLAGDGDRWLMGWDLFSRMRLIEVDCREPRHVAFAPDGRTVAVAVSGGIDLRRWPSGQVVHAIRTEAGQHVDSLQFSVEGDQILAISGYRWRRWRCGDGALLDHHARDVPPNGTHIMYGIDPKGRLGACLHPTQYDVIIFDTLVGADVQRFRTPEGPCVATIVGDTGALAVERQDEGLSIQIIDMATCRILQTLLGHSEPLYAIHSSSDGSTLVGLSQSRQWVWDTRSGQLRDYCRGHAVITDIAFDPAGKMVATTGPSVELRDKHGVAHSECIDGVRFWDLESGKLLHQVPNFRFGSFSEDGRYAWIWSHSGLVRKLDTGTYQASEACFVRDAENSLSIVGEAERGLRPLVRVRRCGKWRAAASSAMPVAVLCDSPSGEHWKPGEFEVIAPVWVHSAPFPRSEPPFDGEVVEFVVSADGTTIAFEYSRREDFSRKSCIGIEHKGGRDTVWIEWEGRTLERVVLSADGTQIMGQLVETENSVETTGHPVLEIRLWDALNGELIRTWNLSHNGYELGSGLLALSPDGKIFATGHGEGPVQIWATESADVEPWTTIGGHQGPITALAFSPNNRQLATGSSDSTVLIFDIERLLKGEHK